MKKKLRLMFVFVICVAMLIGTAASNAMTVSAATPIRSTVNMVKTKKITVVKANRYRMKAVINGKNVKAAGKWTSSNKKVATVNKNGVIKAIKAGKTTITAKYQGKTLKTVVTVSNTCKHTWKVTKKATCVTTGKKTCQLCGKTANVATKNHAWVTETWQKKVGLGKGTEVCVQTCNVCGGDLTHMENSERSIHMFTCHSTISQWYGTDYNGYQIVEISETYCKTCGDANGKRKETVIKTDKNATLHDHYIGNQDLMFVTNP